MKLNDFIDDFLGPAHTIEVKTSGSTGKPKVMQVEKARMLASAKMTCDFLGLTSSDIAHLCMPLDYIAGKMMVVRALERGMKIVATDPSGHPFRNLPSPLPTFSAIVPLQLFNTLQANEETEMLKRIPHVIVGGGAIDDSVAQQLRSFPNDVWSTYGMTETLSHIALRRLSGAHASHLYTPLPGVSLSTDSDDCLIIDCPRICPYPLLTNDRAEIMSDGRFRIIGRRDNVICSGGIKLQIEEIERLLKPYINHPFLITKMPDAKFGEVVVLLTEGNPEQDKLICSTVLEKYQQPRLCLHIDTIPMTETGKIKRGHFHHGKWIVE